MNACRRCVAKRIDLRSTGLVIKRGCEGRFFLLLHDKRGTCLAFDSLSDPRIKDSYVFFLFYSPLISGDYAFVEISCSPELERDKAGERLASRLLLFRNFKFNGSRKICRLVRSCLQVQPAC